ncbi:prepilin-type N-terminal cleavage/methylation domain-containing protein [Lacimicrobium sp. SS2-24]|uniref:prepilin-type N-terminal cleavage/methylation domain-containing protein n=1 Tax=Lacimicrobium sp. SS2-24 TaxID=2005569 RepID=UPI000B4B3493|nr:prepilin-type N-terminal cleavage/methylation domain-containing protein [Lacimicrobium sp. SS2-24]
MLEQRRQRGASLVELMIAMVLGMASLSLLASVTGYGIGTNANLLNQSRLTEELRAVLFLMKREIRRAGINGDALARVQDPVANPSAFANSIVLGAYPGEMANSCILFSYDADLDGELDVPANNENYGFRLRDGAIEVRQAGIGCEDDGWQDVTDSEVVGITSLSFTLAQTTSNQVSSYEVTIDLIGELNNTPQFNRHYEENVLVRAYD